MFVKLGELIEISGVENTESCIAAIDPKILENFKSTASSLKTIAPKADDFLYFSAIMMHSAEASALNYDGTFKVNAKGQPVTVGWNKANDTWRWNSNDPTVLPYKNSNGDIFPEEELVKAYKKWVGKPLCVDHKSSSVEHVRGFIVDTYYDYKLKRVVALCALDKAGYPQLARQVSTGVSTNVSMGTAVGRAVCTDCARVARVEADFCDHMRYKSGYGEINLDLNPIELSIVVTGADPKANIKNVLAAANNLQNYLNLKQKEFNKLASVDSDKVNDLKNALQKASNQLSNLSKEITKISSDYTDQMPGGLADSGPPENVDIAQVEKGTELEMNEHTNDPNLAKEIAYDHLTEDPNYYKGDLDPTSSSEKLSPPQERFASLAQLTELKNSIENQLSQMKNNLDKIANKLTEDTMTKDMNKVAYHQGTTEPTKYPVDPLNQSVRMQDKHMVGTDNMGGADGMFPGDLEKKELRSRAEEERSNLRQAVVNSAKETLDKKAYPQGTEEPKVYPKDKLNDDARLKTDKHMVGKSPFPNTGKVDDLYPGDKDLKEKLSRASLKARFIKKADSNGSLDRGNSAWEVSMDDKILLAASVNELSHNKADLMYDVISTEAFGKNLLTKIRSEGADKVSAVIKQAQVMPEVPAVPAPVAPVSPVSEVPPQEEIGVGEGDPADVVKDLANKLRDLSSDLGEAVNTLVGEQPEMDAAMPVDVTVASNLNVARKQLGPALKLAMLESQANIKEYIKELDMLKDIYASNPSTSDKESVDLIVSESIKEAKDAASDGFKLLTAFVKYARGSKALLKKAQLEKSTTMDTKTETKDADKLGKDMKDTQLASDVNNADAELDDLVKQLEGTKFEAPKPGVKENDPFKGEVAKDKNVDVEFAADGCGDSEMKDMNDLKATKDELKDLEVKPGTKVEVTAADMSTKAGRAAYRAKLAAESSEKHSLQEGNKSGMTPDLDVKPSGDLAKIETIDEVHKVMMDLAKAPVKVRKEAENIHKLISMGELSVDDLDALVAEGLDADAVKYYKNYYKQVDGGGEFAAELVKEYNKKAFDTAVDAHKVKLSRAYELAYDMVAKGMISSDRHAVTAQVNDIMTYNDESFNGLKRMVSKVNVKTAGVLPQIGGYSDTDSLTSIGSGNSLSDELNAAFATSKGRLF